METANFFVGTPFSREQAALQRWKGDNHPHEYTYGGHTYSLTIYVLQNTLYIQQDDVTFTYEKNEGAVTYDPPHGPLTPWVDILENGKGKTVRFHVPDQTPYLLHTVTFVALSVLFTYGVYRTYNHFFPPEPPGKPKQKVPRRFYN